MNVLHKDDFRKLMQDRGGPCVSIYMPAHRIAEEQDPIRLKNLLDSAEAELIARNVRSTEAQELLKPARELINDAEFWQHQDNGLAVFLAPSERLVYRLPIEFEEWVFVGERFYVKPMLPLLSDNDHFYILALGKHDVRLLRATRESFEEVDLGPKTPKSFEEALKYDEFENNLQFHQTRAGKNAAMYHGQGTAERYPKEEVARFFTMLDKGVYNVIGQDHAPLVLAGLEYYFSIYRDTNSYPNLVPEHIARNSEEMRDDEIHTRALELLKPRFDEERRRAATQFENNSNTGIAATDLEKIVPAACNARVETLFVAVDAQRWGKFNRDANRAEVRVEPQPGDEELTNLAAVQTLSNGGRVFAVPMDQVPNNAVAAAVFRF